MKKNGKALMYPMKSDTDCKGAGLVPTRGYPILGNGDGADGTLTLAKQLASQNKKSGSGKSKRKVKK